MSRLSVQTQAFRRGLMLSMLLFNLALTAQAQERQKIQEIQEIQEIQVGFSPEGSAEQLVLNVIEDAHQQIRLMGYSFTSPKVVKALVAAQRRGVDVRVVLDQRGNNNKASRAAMNLLANAGAGVRTSAAYKIQHDKVIISDGQNVQVGSYNYSTSAARSNSENVLVLWGFPAVASVYLQHWQSRWEQGQPYQSAY